MSPSKATRALKQQCYLTEHGLVDRCLDLLVCLRYRVSTVFQKDGSDSLKSHNNTDKLTDQGSSTTATPMFCEVKLPICLWSLDGV